MSFKLTKTEEARFTTLHEEVEKQRSVLEEVVSTAQAEIDNAVETINAARIEFNEKLEAFRQFIEEKASDFRTEADEKSDKWRDSDKGTEVEEWIGEWEAVSLEDIEDVEVPAIELEYPDLPNLGEDLRAEP